MPVLLGGEQIVREQAPERHRVAHAVLAPPRCGCYPGAVARILGRNDDLARWEPRPGQQRLDDVLRRWSLAGNAEWVDDGIRRGEPFLQISRRAAGSVLAWELDRLMSAGYVAVGPYWVPAGWHRDGESYRRIVRLVAEHVLAQPASGDPVYVPKARAELEPLLRLWPHVVALPTTAALSLDELILGRAFPVHPLGVVAGPTWADGRWCSPAEFFHHDLDHARFKVREDLLALGCAVPDAYVDGATLDPATGEHRRILPAVAGLVGPRLWQSATARLALARQLLAAIAAEPQRNLAEAALWLLFELVHEKSLPLAAAVLERELETTRHLDKLRTKCAAGFYAKVGPAPAVVEQLEAARTWLLTSLRGVRA